MTLKPDGCKFQLLTAAEHLTQNTETMHISLVASAVDMLCTKVGV